MTPPKLKTRTPNPLGMMNAQDPMFKAMIRLKDPAFKPPLTCIKPLKEETQAVETETLIIGGSVKPFTRLLKGSLVSVVRIPVPITGQNLYLELRPRNFKGQSTSAIFIQDVNKRHVRLDYGYNKSTGQIDYHWHQAKGLSETFKVTNHLPTGHWGKWLYRVGKTTKYVGTTFVVFAVVTDMIDIVIAEKPLQQLSKVAGAWSTAFIGCQRMGALGSRLGFRINPLFGTILGGGLGCIMGSMGGHFLGDWAGNKAYHLAETYYYRVLQPEQIEYNQPL